MLHDRRAALAGGAALGFGPDEWVTAVLGIAPTRGKARNDGPDLNEPGRGSGCVSPSPTTDDLRKGTAKRKGKDLADCESGRLRIGKPIISRYPIWKIFGV